MAAPNIKRESHKQQLGHYNNKIDTQILIHFFVVVFLAHVEPPSDPNAICKFKAEIQNVDTHIKNLVQQINPSNSNESKIILTFFSVILKISKCSRFIKSETSIVSQKKNKINANVSILENPSGSAGIALNSLNCQNYKLNNPLASYSDQMIKNGFKILCDWIKYSYFIKNLEMWINGIIERIQVKSF